MNSRMINPGRVLADDSDDFSLPPLPSIPTPPPLPFSTSSGEFPITTTSSSHSSHSSFSSTDTSSSSTFTSDDSSASSFTTGHHSSSFSTGSSFTTLGPSSGLLAPSNGSDGPGATSNHHKISAGIIGMIVALSVFSLIIILICIRVWYMRRRKAQRANTNANWTWDGKPNPSMAEKAIPNARSQRVPSISVYSEESEGSRWSYRQSNVPVTAQTNHRTSWFDSLYGSYNRDDAAEPASPLPDITYARPSLSLEVPSTTETNPANNQYLTPASDLSTPVFSVPRVTEAGVPYILATVQRPFIRKLADELPTTTGQQLGVIRQFDDGWTLCVALNGNTTGPQGMVPTECLKRISKDSSIIDTPVAGPSTGSNNVVYGKRQSSLLK